MDDRRDGANEGRPGDGSAVAPPSNSRAGNPASRQAARRREALGLHIEQIVEAHRSGSDLREALAGLDLDHWELDQLRKGLSGESTPLRDLVLEGVAFRNKCRTDIGWGPGIQQLSVRELEDFRSTLITDATLGVALLEETQRAVNALIRNGEMGVVKKLTTFRNKIGQSVNDLKGIIGEKGNAEAATNSESMVEPEEQASWTERESPAPDSMPAESRGASRPRVVIRRTAAAAEKSHVKPLLMLLGLAVIVWGVFILPELGGKTIPALTLDDISPRSEIRRMVAKPPSLFIELDGPAWRALSREDRQALVDDIGRTASAAGYNGAQFRLEDGTTAAQWLREKGGKLIK